MYFDPIWFLFVIPPVLLAMFAQWRVKSAYHEMSQVPARMSGFQAARAMLDSAGLQQIGIEQTPGELSDHYDPRAKVLRLSSNVYGGNSMAAVGIACHEAGHAMQDAMHYAPLVIRNAAVPAANIGSGLGGTVAMVGLAFGLQPLVWVGVLAFAAVAFFQVINLPVEFDASNRAKHQLVAQGIIAERDLPLVSKVLNAAALTYVAATLQSLMMLAYFLLRALGDRR
ncbi:Putative neutral zinc metallopeptidase [Rosistilla ulvae]|uniref:Neutral zinc metallopeptidase n=2 Tax=Rosistilla ulvae TaxID=1930277 RepID=A0A517LZE3_9BACT|nr:zinc metallopeptidase [Rosistilla ulvae]QDS87992.1 Putative neutral zinc metallopeptidase [Rosistilla ulvae]